eukprot:100664-Chlamydomonas_euryale.AAC.1
MTAFEVDYHGSKSSPPKKAIGRRGEVQESYSQLPRPAPHPSLRCKTCLCQPTRLKHRRHDDDVGGGVDEVREWLVILEAEARNVAVHKLAAALGRAERGVLDKVDALLWREPRDDADDELVVAPAAEPDALAQRLSRGRLALGDIGACVGHRKEGVVGGVPQVGVDAVAHAQELRARTVSGGEGAVRA